MFGPEAFTGAGLGVGFDTVFFTVSTGLVFFGVVFFGGLGAVDPLR
jgi:hypothetical protein